jgi:hypothetical protein
VRLDGDLADAQDGGDLFIETPGNHHGEDFTLAWQLLPEIAKSKAFFCVIVQARRRPH